jgi:hypothetical protein
MLDLFSLEARHFSPNRTELVGDGLVRFEAQQPLGWVIEQWLFLLELRLIARVFEMS